MHQRSLGLLLFLLLALAHAGCVDLTGRGPAPLDRTVDVQNLQKYERAGHVYCMRGFLGIWSTGMDALADKIDTEVGAAAVSVANEEWTKLRDWIIAEKKNGRMKEPLVLLGHSYGADDMIRISMQLQKEKITVDLLVLIDPVTPPPVPANVRRVYCVYKSHPMTDWYPAWRGVPATVVDPITPLVNINLRDSEVGFNTQAVSHPNIEKMEGVHNMVIEEIKKTCPMRKDWVQRPSGAGGTGTGTVSN